MKHIRLNKIINWFDNLPADSTKQVKPSRQVGRALFFLCYIVTYAKRAEVLLYGCIDVLSVVGLLNFH